MQRPSRSTTWPASRRPSTSKNDFPSSLIGKRRARLWRASSFRGSAERRTCAGGKFAVAITHSIAVEHGWDDREGEREPKSVAGVREVPLPETLRVHLATHTKRLKLRGDALVFPQPNARSKPFTPGYVQDRADEAWKAGKLSRVTLHECRHGYRSFLDAAGISEARADRYLGHASSSVGRLYTHALEGQLAEDAAPLDEYLTAAASGKVVRIETGARTGARKEQRA